MNNFYNQQIDTLQSQINRLQNLNTTQHQPPLSQEEQIRNLIKQELNTLLPGQIQEPLTPLSEHQQMLKQIDDLAQAVLTPDDIQFLNSPDMIKCFPVFLKSNKGKEAATLLIQEYRTFVEGK